MPLKYGLAHPVPCSIYRSISSITCHCLYYIWGFDASSAVASKHHALLCPTRYAKLDEDSLRPIM